MIHERGEAILGLWRKCPEMICGYESLPMTHGKRAQEIRKRSTGQEINRERQMFACSAFRPKIRRAFVTSALAAGVMALAGSAIAAPFPLFPFAMPEPPQAVQPTPSDEPDAPFELPARFKRQVVNYSTREAAGTIIIDTPNTYLYYVLGNGQAIRYGIGVGREGFMLVRHADGHEEGRVAGLDSTAGDDRAPALSAAPDGRRPRQSVRRAGDVSRRHGLPHSRHQRAFDHRHPCLFRLHPPDQP
jgi:hypothetical protein